MELKFKRKIKHDSPVDEILDHDYKVFLFKLILRLVTLIVGISFVLTTENSLIFSISIFMMIIVLFSLAPQSLDEDIFKEISLRFERKLIIRDFKNKGNKYKNFLIFEFIFNLLFVIIFYVLIINIINFSNIEDLFIWQKIVKILSFILIPFFIILVTLCFFLKPKVIQKYFYTKIFNLN